MAKLISKTYGEALFELAVEEGKVDVFLEEISQLLEILKKEDEFTKMMNHPKILKEDKIKVVENVFKGRISDEILSEARKKALANAAKIEAEAKEEAARIMERARQEAELEKQKAADDVKKEMVSIASLMAGKVVAASIDTTVQESLINETLKEIGESTWLS